MKDPIKFNMYARYLKRPLDFCCALAAIICLSPILVVLTVLGAIKMKGNLLRSTSLDFFLLGGPALPHRHALFFGPAAFRSLSLPKGAAALVKPSLAPLAVIPAQAGISLLVPRVSALACNDRCRETLMEAV